MTEQPSRAVSTVISLIIFKYGLLIAVYPLAGISAGPELPNCPLPPASLRPPEHKQRRTIYRPDRSRHYFIGLFHRLFWLIGDPWNRNQSTCFDLPFCSFMDLLSVIALGKLFHYAGKEWNLILITYRFIDFVFNFIIFPLRDFGVQGTWLLKQLIC